MNSLLLPSLEYWLPEKELRENTSDGPNVNSGRLNVPENEHQKPLINCSGGGTHVVGETEHDLGRSVPPSGDVFSHETLVRTALGAGTSTGSVSPCETEVADFEFTVRIDQ